MKKLKIQYLEFEKPTKDYLMLFFFAYFSDVFFKVLYNACSHRDKSLHSKHIFYHDCNH